MDTDVLIDGNRALLALAEQTRRGSREIVGRAREARGIAALVSARAVQINEQFGLVRYLSSKTSAGTSVIHTRLIRRLQAEAAETYGRIKALRAKLPPPTETPD